MPCLFDTSILSDLVRNPQDRVRSRLEGKGQPIGGNDLLIASHALSSGHILVTDEREFSRIDGLLRENWLR